MLKKLALLLTLLLLFLGLSACDESNEPAPHTNIGNGDYFQVVGPDCQLSGRLYHADYCFVGICGTPPLPDPMPPQGAGYVLVNDAGTSVLLSQFTPAEDFQDGDRYTLVGEYFPPDTSQPVKQWSQSMDTCINFFENYPKADVFCGKPEGENPCVFPSLNTETNWPDSNRLLPVQEHAAKIHGDLLLLQVYYGGCSVASDQMRLITDGGIMESFPPQVRLEVHDTRPAADMTCMMLVHDRLAFDLSSLKDHAPIYLNIDKEQILYEGGDACNTTPLLRPQ